MKWRYRGRKFAGGNALADFVVSQSIGPGETPPDSHAHYLDGKQFVVITRQGKQPSEEIFRRSFTTHEGFNQIRDEESDA
jgi:hypothetical protein